MFSSLLSAERPCSLGGGPFRLPHEKNRRTVAGTAVLPTWCSGLLALEVAELLQDLIRGGDDAGVGLEAALGDDQVGEFLGQVHVRHFQRSTGEAPDPGVARSAELHAAGVGGSNVGRTAGFLQAGGVGELCQRDLGEDLLDAVAEGTDQGAVVAEGEGFQLRRQTRSGR